jgi:hypothetical protein
MERIGQDDSGQHDAQRGYDHVRDHIDLAH